MSLNITFVGALLGASGLLAISAITNGGPADMSTRKTHPKWVGSDARKQYCISHTNMTDSSALQELRQLTAQHERGVMESTPDVGQFLTFLVRMLKAKNVVEGGSFTGTLCYYRHSEQHFLFILDFSDLIRRVEYLRQ